MIEAMLLLVPGLLILGVLASRRHSEPNRGGGVITGRGRSTLALVGGAIAVGTGFSYIWIIAHQGGSVEVPRVVIVSGMIFLASVLVIAGASIHGRRASRAVGLPGAVLLLLLGVVGIFSIGLPLLVAGTLALANPRTNP
jgi:hypothetical protein